LPAINDGLPINTTTLNRQRLRVKLTASFGTDVSQYEVMEAS
jgi:hypothetical protein